MCLSQSQPLDHINTSDLLRKRERRGEERDGVRVKQSCVRGVGVGCQHNISQFRFEISATLIPWL